MNTKSALDFLRNHQPMPGDFEITDEERETYSLILDHFEKHPHPACIPLLINSVSKETGLEMYEHIKFILMSHKKTDVIPHLKEGLLKGNDGVKYRCCQWAMDVNAWELKEAVKSLRNHSDEDIREAAESFIELKNEDGDFL